MNAPAEKSDDPSVRALYKLRVTGPIPADLLHEFEALEISVEPAETVVYGPLPDQSALFGLLARIHDLGLHLLEVRQLTDTDLPAED